MPHSGEGLAGVQVAQVTCLFAISVLSSLLMYGQCFLLSFCHHHSYNLFIAKWNNSLKAEWESGVKHITTMPRDNCQVPKWSNKDSYRISKRKYLFVGLRKISCELILNFNMLTQELSSPKRWVFWFKGDTPCFWKKSLQLMERLYASLG